MLARIIVPLDGSHLAERALPYAVRLADLFEAKLLLLHVSAPHDIHLLVASGAGSSEAVQPVGAAQFYEARVEEIRANLLIRAADRAHVLSRFDASLETVIPDQESESYLQQVKHLLARPGQRQFLPLDRIETEVVYGRTVEELREVASMQGPDPSLVVMATHSRAGLNRLVLNNMGSALLQQPGVQVVLLRPCLGESGQTLQAILDEPVALCPGQGSRIVITLDGKPPAEAVIEPALAIALKLGAEVHLLTVVPDLDPLVYTTYVLPAVSDVQAIKASFHQTAVTYLNQVAERLEAAGVPVVKTVRFGNTIQQIIDYVRTTNPCMLAMATHAHGRMGDIFLGSVAEEVIRRSNLPVLTVHTGQAR